MYIWGFSLERRKMDKIIELPRYELYKLEGKDVKVFDYADTFGEAIKKADAYVDEKFETVMIFDAFTGASSMMYANRPINEKKKFVE